MNDIGANPGTGELADLVAVHLQDEEAVLAEALPMVRALKAAFTQTSREALPEFVQSHYVLANLLADIKVRRQRFRERMARRFQCDPETITVSRIVNGLPTRQQEALGTCAARVRSMALEFVALNRWLTIHLRIHLDAYNRLLCDLTGSAHNSGRYGPAGKAETGDFRPLIQIQG